MVCKHPERLKFDEGLLDGTISQVQIAEIVRCNRRTVYRHLHNHLAVDLLQTANINQNILVDSLTALQWKTEKIISDAMKGKKYETALKAITRREAQIKLAAELTGELQKPRENEQQERRKAEQLERAIDSLIARAKAEGIELTPLEAINSLAAIEPDVFKLIPLTRFKGEVPSAQTIH